MSESGKEKVVTEIAKNHPKIASKLKKLEIKNTPNHKYRAYIRTLFLLINVVDFRYIIQSFPLITLAKFWKNSFSLSRTATFDRFLTANLRHKDGKTHVHSVPVNLCCPQNDLRKKHLHGHFVIVSVTFANL